MHIEPLPNDRTTVRRFVEELWVPYHRALETAVDAHGLADDADVVAKAVEFQLGRVESPNHRTWVAVDGKTEDTAALAVETTDLAGFVAASLDASPSVFDRPDRLEIDDLFVRERYRGTGLSRELVRRAVEHARETGCAELALDVHLDYERAVEFYERLGFEPHRRRMLLDVDER